MIKNILVVIDIQKEYITPGRPYYLHGIDPSLEKCTEVLAFARKHNWDIIHIQHSNGDNAPKFNPTNEYFDFVAEFTPRANEKHFVKDDFSCYSSAEFLDFMQAAYTSAEVNTYIIGYNSVMCCLSTLEEARCRKHKMFFVQDASYAKSIEDRDEATMHKTMVGIYKAKGLATVISTEDLLGA